MEQEVVQEAPGVEAVADGDSDDEDEDHPLSGSESWRRAGSLLGGLPPLKPLAAKPEQCGDLLLVQRLGCVLEASRAETWLEPPDLSRFLVKTRPPRFLRSAYEMLSVA